MATVHGMAYKNKRKTWLTEEILNEIGGHPEEISDLRLSKKEIFRRKMGTFSTERIGPLFGTRKLAVSSQ